MNKIKIFLILIVLFISISAVSAEGNFTALQNEIDASDNSIDIQQDYKYDNLADNGLESGISINKSNFVINGNDHTIDGSNQARIFNITGDNVTILNLNLINGNSDNGGAILTEKSITINNVSFINNNATGGGSIYSTASSTIRNCYFDNNTAKFGGSIYFFKASLSVENSTFTNSKSTYAPAIYCLSIEELNITDCIFENLYAEESAGAIGIHYLNNANINNCTFINTTSRKNGGAINIDPLQTCYGHIPKIIINKSRFFNSTGDYGGALAILSGGLEHSLSHKNEHIFFGTLNMNDCEFLDNTASYSGGAIYFSGLNATIKNTHFYRNKLDSNSEKYFGGGIYSDFSNTTIENCEFVDNSRQGIYAYDNKFMTYTSDDTFEYENRLTVKDTNFSNNGESIHAVFTDCDLNNNIVENYTLTLNKTEYISNVHEIAKSISLINNTINVETLPTKYDSRDWGWVSSVKNQGIMGACWAFGTCGALESALLKATGIEYDFSENNMQNTMLQFTKYGILGRVEGSAFNGQGMEYILSWFGVMPSEDDTYDEVGKLSPLIITDDEKIHIFDAIFIGPRKNSTDNNALKKAILRCGSITTSYSHDDTPNNYNKNTSAYYQNEYNTTNHQISIVGWDDNYSASNFIMSPPGDGAFIIKNSHGPEFGDNGFLYISYYDTSLLNTTLGIGFIIENTENYTTNYQTDLSGLQKTVTNNGSILSYKNTYESAYGPELISAVGTYFEENEDYTLEIYVNDELMHTQTGIAPFTGYHTVKLTTEIPITKGDIFTALMKKASVRTFEMSRQHYKENMTFIDLGDGWKDLALENKTISLKVYTKDLAIYTQDLVKIYKNESKFVAEIGAANETVTFEINGKNYTRNSDENGTASMAINLGPGDYTIKTTYNNVTVENTITVLPTLIAENLVKYYRNESQFFIDLIDGEGNPVNGTNITMNINGVFYNRETNENGTARLNINLIPGEYILTAIDPLTGLQMSYNITVLPVLTAEDLEMTYKDGSQFTAKVVDGQGKALANAKVTFNINGVFYHKTTDENGTAKLNINLMAGEYIITSQYGQATISNKITITA
ncbi:MAG: right-handed parallel beta-helix repeat-containing protein [Methanobrevibacter sp.]|nr:right-handed parallel beta-helix repeat-containing protein [Methanobrevibacter sp.]